MGLDPFHRHRHRYLDPIALHPAPKDAGIALVDPDGNGPAVDLQARAAAPAGNTERDGKRGRRRRLDSQGHSPLPRILRPLLQHHAPAIHFQFTPARHIQIYARLSLAL